MIDNAILAAQNYKIEIAKNNIEVRIGLCKTNNTHFESVWDKNILYPYDTIIKKSEHLIVYKNNYDGEEYNVFSPVEVFVTCFKHVSGCLRNCPWGGCSCVIAIVPKGAEYSTCATGSCDIMMSNQIIVFSSKEKLEEYLKTH